MSLDGRRPGPRVLNARNVESGSRNLRVDQQTRGETARLRALTGCPCIGGNGGDGTTREQKIATPLRT
eukprot:3421818-Lingulodinium_polyedra.AAC.1